ncbi:MAG: DedA family protein [Opitutaceae bacterium]|nr:DedA family protein [Opitutaceae bacterium]
MLESLLDLLQESSLSLWGPFLLLLLCGVGLPLPEDIVLVVAGMLAQDDGRSWIATAVLMYIGVLAGDSIIFLLGRHYGARLLAWEGTHNLFPPKKQARVQRLFDRHGSYVLLIARFLPGLRAPVFSTAGAMQVGYLKFLTYDGAAALVSAPVFVWFGHWLWLKFDDDIQNLNAALSRTEWYTVWVAAGLLLVALMVWRLRPRNRPPNPPS